MKYCNYHMHTTFCDGANTAKEMTEAALAAGCEEIGFSGHSYLPFDPSWTMSPETAAAYRQCIGDLKEHYADRISIRLGIEQDLCSDPSDLGLYEYVIGSVHCIFREEHYISVDASAKTMKQGIDQWYGGDVYAFVDDYYKSVAQVYKKTHCQIVGHFDLVTKFIEQTDFLDITDPQYCRAADRALEELMAQPVAFELNTGAISRGYRTAPYPDERILAQLGEAGRPVLFSSDAHRTEDILFGLDEAKRLADTYKLNLFDDLDTLLQWQKIQPQY